VGFAMDILDRYKDSLEGTWADPADSVLESGTPDSLEDTSGAILGQDIPGKQECFGEIHSLLVFVVTLVCECDVSCLCLWL